ncbi:MAG: pectinesterase family protein [Bacteroidaceae bacterium]
MKNRIFLMLLCLGSYLGVQAQTTILPDVPVKGEDYTLSLQDGSIIPTDVAGNVNYTNGFFRVVVNQNAFSFNGAQHGFAFGATNVLEIGVAGSVNLQIGACHYSAAGAMTVTDAGGTVVGTQEAQTALCYHEDQGTLDFAYRGEATTLKVSFPGTVYVPVILVKAVVTQESDGRTDVWDFGAAQLDETVYNNHLTEDVINGWYDASIEVGSTNNVLPSSWKAGILSWTGGKNDRLRTANTNLTRYDNKNAVTIEGQTLTGYIYVNGAAQTSRYLSLELNEDDEVMLYCSSQNGTGKINFVYVADPTKQTDLGSAPTAGTLLTFAAKQAGTYKIYDTEDKPSYYRVLRKPAVYARVHGAVSADASLAEGYGVVFANEAGKEWTATVSGGTYEASLPMGHTYALSLANANGYVISNGTSLAVEEADVVRDVVVSKVDLCTVSGAINGLGESISRLQLAYIPAEERVYVPEPAIDATAGTYTVQLEPGVPYVVVAQGVNDYELTVQAITAAGDQTMDLTFEPKPRYAVTLEAQGLTAEQKATLQATFTNLHEEGYVYAFASLDGVTLRNGVYAVELSGLEAYPLEQALTSNLKVDGKAVSKPVQFKTVTEWDFADRDITASDTYYKGMALAGGVKNEKAKGHLVAGNGASVVVPAQKGDKLTVSYYYAANFSINGGEAVTTASGSTSKVEKVVYQNEAEGGVTITFAATSYVTNIRVDKVVPFAATLTVGQGKDYASINEALDAVRGMERPNNERVTLLIEPGNYEEMLVVDVPNISLVNAAAVPSIALKDKGVNIDANAVRITSYYGHGYSYYSMANNQKWNAEVLAVNKENGYLSYENKGSGSTNGSYWNATVVVTADGFEAENIIFENSFNQYVSAKEADDVVVEWETGGKGVRPTTAGSTDVQNKSFVERAAALALVGSDKVVLYNCRVIGRQDSFYGGDGVRVAVYKGVMMGATDYLFGEMTAVFYQSQLAMNTSEDKNDVSYITAGKQNSGRGYLMYECTVTSAEPETETASAYRSKPGYFGRPWQPNTTETVFYNTTIETSNSPGYDGQSLIVPAGWNNTLSGESPYCVEYGTKELSGVDNTSKRVSWAGVLTEPKLADGTDITLLNFTKGNDGWDPFPALIERGLSISQTEQADATFRLRHTDGLVSLEGLGQEALVAVYAADGTLVKLFQVDGEASFRLGSGLWLVRVNQQTVKVAVR